MPLQLCADTTPTTQQREYVDKHDQPSCRETVKHESEIPAIHSLVYRFSKTYPSYEAASEVASSSSNAFQRWTTGISLISAIPNRIRSFSSALDCTRICRRNVRVILPKRISTIFSQEPCVGVSTYLNRLGRVAK